MDYEKGKQIEDALYYLNEIIPNWEDRKEMKSAEELEEIYSKIETCIEILKKVLGKNY